MNNYILQHRGKVEDRFYVYLHRKLSDNSVFYVGKGCGSRAWNQHGRNKYWKNIVNKHGLEVEILFDNLDENTALQVEKDTILEFKYFGYSLCNITEGGESPRFTKETLEKLSVAGKGRKKSDAHKLAISAAHIGKDSSKMIGSGNPNFDGSVYSFIHSDGRLFTGTRQNLCKFDNLKPTALNGLFLKNRTRISSFGWSLIKE